MKKQSIEGVVLERFDSHLSVTLTAPGGRDYPAEIDLDRFADIDQPHCIAGARFVIAEPGPELRLWRNRSRKGAPKVSPNASQSVSAAEYGGEL